MDLAFGGRQGWVLKPEVAGRGGRLGVCLSICPGIPLTGSHPRPRGCTSSWKATGVHPPTLSPRGPSPQGFHRFPCHLPLRRCRKPAFTPTLQARTWGLPPPIPPLPSPPPSARAQGTVLAPSGLGFQPFASSCLFLGGWPGASCQRWGEFVPDRWGRGARGWGGGEATVPASNALVARFRPRLTFQEMSFRFRGPRHRQSCPPRSAGARHSSAPGSPTFPCPSRGF